MRDLAPDFGSLTTGGIARHRDHITGTTAPASLLTEKYPALPAERISGSGPFQPINISPRLNKLLLSIV